LHPHDDLDIQSTVVFGEFLAYAGVVPWAHPLSFGLGTSAHIMSKQRVGKSGSRSTVADRKPLNQITDAHELDLLKRLSQFNARFRDTLEVDKVLSSALRMSMDFFGATEGCVAAVRPGRDQADVLFPDPEDSAWDRGLLARIFAGGHNVAIPADLMMARIRRYDRIWGALVIRSRGADFQFDARKAFSSIGVAATQLVERINDLRIREVRARIDHKILEQIGPKDLFYQILHGIRSLVAYDHSSALLTCDDAQSSLQVVGEQIAWRKSKSQKVGLKLPLGKDVLQLLKQNVVYGFNRDGKSWQDWTDSQAAALAQLLDYNRDEQGAIAEGTTLAAPLITRHGVVGVLKVASVHPGALGPYEADIISQFLPPVAVALQNMRRTESLEERMRAAERKQAMADLARAVSHDVNNSIGAVVPLVQQMQEDLQSASLTPEVFRRDLDEIERSLQICRRIFGGMLGFARGATRNASDVYLRREIDSMLAVYQEGLDRTAITVTVQVPHDLPPLVGIQADIDQLLLNLIGNARDAMETGGSLTIGAARVENRIELTVADTGCGIAPENMARIQEPFFTTKRSGNGLGLSICRSIVSQLRGKLQLESAVGRGTTVKISLPLPQEALA
jgi:two-component system, NtrC family, sensor kinase